MIFLVILGILTFVLRFIPHMPNFSPVIALAVLSGVVCREKRYFLIPVIVVVLSDVFLGITDVSAFVWFAVLLISLFSRILKNNVIGVLGYSLLSAFLYFAITNFGVWLMGWYSYSLWGLYTCYLRAVPFFRMQILSTVVFTFIFYIVFDIVGARRENFLTKRVLYKK